MLLPPPCCAVEISTQPVAPVPLKVCASQWVSFIWSAFPPPSLRPAAELPSVYCGHLGASIRPILCPGTSPFAIFMFPEELIKRHVYLTQFALHNCPQIAWLWGRMWGILHFFCRAVPAEVGAAGGITAPWLCLASALTGVRMEQAGRSLPALRTCTGCNIKEGSSWERQFACLGIAAPFKGRLPATVPFRAVRGSKSSDRSDAP